MSDTSLDYVSSDIRILSDRDHVRLRLPVYAGNTKTTEYEVPLFINGGIEIKNIEFIPAVYKCINEIIDNSLDEFTKCGKTDNILTITSNSNSGEFTISDNGRGVPIDMHETGRYTPELVFSSLRSGRNFTEHNDVGVIGMNGMGASITCFCSTLFNIQIVRGSKKYDQMITNGGLDISEPEITRVRGKHSGTSITFKLDESVFENIIIPEELISNRAIEVALTNKNVTVEHNGITSKYKNGFDDYIKNMGNKFFKFEYNNIEFYTILDYDTGPDEKIFTWVNGSMLFDGGICNTQFLNSFYDIIIEHLSADAKKNKCVVTKNDIRENLLVIGNLKIANPEYDAQSKTRLTSPNMKKEFNEMLVNQWSLFSRRNKDWLQAIIARANKRHHSIADDKAVKLLSKRSTKQISGLIDATSNNRSSCMLIITEGDSAASQITQARDPKTMASLPLRGKINNVYGCTVAQLIKMDKVRDLITAIGLVPGQKANRSELRYGKIVIATDADYDGSDIFTLLINLFYSYWPELFDKKYDPIVYRLVAPNICLTKGKERIHIPSMSEYEAVKFKYVGYTVNYYKGLGSMVRADWEMILNSRVNLLPIVDDGNIKGTLELLFGPNSNDRKQWLMGPAYEE